MSNTFLIYFMSIPMLCMSQSNVLPNGGEANGTNGAMSYSVGQIDYTTIEASEGSISLGVQQPYEIYVLEDKNFDLEANLSLYPNPTYQNAMLSISDYDGQKLKYVLYDVSGKLLFDHKINQKESIIPLEDYSASLYILTVYYIDSKSSKSFKIIKK